MRTSMIFRLRDTLVGLIPLFLGGVMLGSFLFIPTFYQRYLFSFESRENQAIELLTFACVLTAGIVLVRSGIRLLATRRGRPFIVTARENSGAIVILTIGFASLFFAGEEVNWGQIFYHWGVPQEEIRTQYGPMTIHNIEDSPVRIQALGGLFLVLGFIGLPIAWRFREQLNLSEAWKPSIPEYPSILAMLTPLLWSRLVVTSDSARTAIIATLGDEGYHGVLGQLDEQVEFLISVSLLIYSVYRLSAVTRALSGRAAG